MNTYWISLPCDLLSSLASFQCSLLHHLHLSSDLGLSKYVNQHSHLNLSRDVRLPVLYDLDFNTFGTILMGLRIFCPYPKSKKSIESLLIATSTTNLSCIVPMEPNESSNNPPGGCTFWTPLSHPNQPPAPKVQSCSLL